MAASNEGTRKPHGIDVFVLDTGAILEGLNVSPAQCVTTPEVEAEIGAGGRTGRRWEQLEAAGMRVVAPTNASRARVAAAATKAGNLARLSSADQSVLALALDVAPHAVLWSVDFTVLDVAIRLGIPTRGVAGRAPEKPLDWAARCSGCNRVFPAKQAGTACPVCGSPVRLKPAGARARAPPGPGGPESRPGPARPRRP